MSQDPSALDVAQALEYSLNSCGYLLYLENMRI